MGSPRESTRYSAASRSVPEMPTRYSTRNVAALASTNRRPFSASTFSIACRILSCTVALFTRGSNSPAFFSSGGTKRKA